MKKTKANQVPNFILKHFSIGHIDRSCMVTFVLLLIGSTRPTVMSPDGQFMWTGAESTE